MYPECNRCAEQQSKEYPGSINVNKTQKKKLNDNFIFILNFVRILIMFYTSVFQFKTKNSDDSLGLGP